MGQLDFYLSLIVSFYSSLFSFESLHPKLSASLTPCSCLGALCYERIPLLLPLAAEFLSFVFSCKLVRFSLFFFFFFFFSFLNGLEIPFFFPFYYMCEVSLVFPTPRLGRYLIRTGFDFFLSLSLSCVCFGVLFGINFGCWTNIFFIAFKNINNIFKEGKVQFY